MTSYTPRLQGNPGFFSALQLVKSQSLEEAVQYVWQTIISTWFNSLDGYTVSYKASTLANNNEPDGIAIRVMELAPKIELSTDFAERQILLVQCNRPSSDTPAGWDGIVENRFRDDLSQTLNDSEKLYGAVAIGTKVRFYRFDGKAPYNQQLTQLHAGAIDMNAPNGITEVENMMNYVKANGWQWAST
ncbi:hypothetical protein P170DRAFT_434976 [Aspergillus steynii IBT 23096]|uniref:Uncharacterized protein n=1 Tax=Aspergillus steynii IBT 23096 TaxID=1392250 RepID=A0A2I2GK77_9EURO|nr:uncharacterized protein P170DRAFT_434976 [Aspergillus steynii IBT 23096]PLB53283.1 hypothetical protein P170DRAFT_434976 [Aspergillus steynii IBT 23096]